MSGIYFFNGNYVRKEEARVGIDSALAGRGLGVFEGIRGYWNPDHEEIYVFRLREHMERLERSSRMLFIKLPEDVGTLCDIVCEVLRRNAFRTDVHIRPIAYKASEEITSKLLIIHQQEDGFAISASPLGRYIKGSSGVRCTISSWRRISDNAIPPSAKITGSYVNSALARTEAALNGFDEALFLTEAGMIAECSAQNVFLLRGGKLITPPATEGILEGITRDTVSLIARKELGLDVVERPIGRSEFHTAEEAFLTGTGSEIKSIVSVDHRPVSSGEPGPVATKIAALYERIARGNHPAYVHWCTPVSGEHHRTGGSAKAPSRS